MDVAIASFALLILSPLFALLALLVKLSSPGPVFHRGERVGKEGRLFRIYKFRTMRADAAGPRITGAGDARITRIGGWLRRTKLDELPQLINVIAGEMLLVGPRPEDPEYVALYTPEQRALLDYPPGITSAASLQYRDEERILAGDDWERRYRDEVMPAKLAIELVYAKNRSLATDIGVIVRTIIALIGKRSEAASRLEESGTPK